MHPNLLEPLPGGPPLLELMWGHDGYIHYRAGFDTREDIVGGSDEMEAEDFLELAQDPSADSFNRILDRKSAPVAAPPINPENAWVHIHVGALADLVPPRFRLAARDPAEPLA